jgi:hypothetical protein
VNTLCDVRALLLNGYQYVKGSVVEAWRWRESSKQMKMAGNKKRREI